jgi:hypothetical protein
MMKQMHNKHGNPLYFFVSFTVMAFVALYCFAQDSGKVDDSASRAFFEFGMTEEQIREKRAKEAAEGEKIRQEYAAEQAKKQEQKEQMEAERRKYAESFGCLDYVDDVILTQAEITPSNFELAKKVMIIPSFNDEQYRVLAAVDDFIIYTADINGRVWQVALFADKGFTYPSGTKFDIKSVYQNIGTKRFSGVLGGSADIITLKRLGKNIFTEPTTINQANVTERETQREPQARTAQTTVNGITADTIVYITKTGEKYHRDGCGSLSRSKIQTTLGKVSGRLAPCSVCKPPVLPR